ncbi:hypothetical protein SDC9_190949 [bioreactor metagenome]|uniref:Uncharacterized protein n=1 Tax=bioreactor metagenome TaxID=1076179 RepID=A0A645HWZ7_9ZZZZ
MSFGLLLELRATLGIIGVLGDDWGDNSTMNNFSSKNLVTQFTIGYRF